MMHSPSVQPISSSSPGTGSVTTMWEEATLSRSRSGPSQLLAAAPIASTAEPARTVPAAVRATTPPPASRSESTGEDSKRSTPRSRRRSRRPSASRAGCTVAPLGEIAPARSRRGAAAQTQRTQQRQDNQDHAPPTPPNPPPPPPPPATPPTPPAPLLRVP